MPCGFGTKRLGGLARERSAGRSRKALYPLGAQISTDGPRAAAVFAASGRVMPASAAHHSDVVVADAAGRADGAYGRAAVVVLSSASPQMSVPAFDPLVVNPIGWKPTGAVRPLPTEVTAETDPATRAGVLAATAAPER